MSRRLDGRPAPDSGPLRERLDVYRAIRQRDGGISALAKLVEMLEAELAGEGSGPAGREPALAR